MKILVTGRGTSGSWAIRGEQLGGAIGATVLRNAARLSGYDLAVIVKRVPQELLMRLRAARIPLVYDVLDGWPQPTGNDEWKRDDCMNWLRGQVKALRPIALVAATKAMAEDCVEFGLPVLALPHHARPGQAINPIRPTVQVVGYQGGEHYLGHWRSAIETDCAKRGYKFVVNPITLDRIDIVVAVRAASGYAARRWKSNVKLANAQGSGTPCIIDREEGYVETESGGEVWVQQPDDLSAAFESLEEEGARQAASKRLQAGTLTLERIATEYKTWLQALNF